MVTEGTLKMLKGSLQNFVVVKSDQCKEEKKEWLEPATFQESGNTMKQTSLQPRSMPYVLIMKQTGFIQPKSKICQTTRLIDMVNAGGSLQM